MLQIFVLDTLPITTYNCSRHTAWKKISREAARLYNIRIEYIVYPGSNTFYFVINTIIHTHTLQHTPSAPKSPDTLHTQTHIRRKETLNHGTKTHKTIIIAR